MERLECERMFVAVMETGGFSRAAARLGTSPGQASKLVGRLEKELGVQLLNRTTRALSPTEVGSAYFDRIKGLIEAFDALDDSVRTASGEARGRLALSVPVSFGTAQLAPALVDFARAYPEILLDVSFSDRIVSLIDEGFDAAVRIGVPSDASLIIRKLCDTRIVCAAAPGYLAERGEPAERATSPRMSASSTPIFTIRSSGASARHPATDRFGCRCMAVCASPMPRLAS